MTKAKTVKKHNAKGTSLKARLKLVKQTLINMRAQKTGISSASILLTGDPGVGKTSYIRFLSRLLGMHLTTLEVPHMVEEHIINIPFIRYNPATNKSKSDAIGGRKSEFELILSDSNLYSTLKRTKPITDKQYMRAMYSGHPDYAQVRKVFEALGGAKGVIPEPISAVREKFTTILFLDEYFRRTSSSVRNMLRGILNKKLGLNDLPRTVYPIYATNIDDDGMDSIPTNNQFNQIEMASPDKDSWFDFVKDDAIANGIDLKDETVEAFYEVIQEGELSMRDRDADFYISPRRWHQMMFYANESLYPQVKNLNVGRALLTNLKASLTNYQTNETSRKYQEIAQKMCDIMNAQGNFTITPDDVLPNSRWRETLHHQIVRKMRLGDARKYVPVISGLPGIGKTYQASTIAERLKLGLVYIDCSTLGHEDSMGTALSREDDGAISVEFSESKLQKLIEKMCAEVEPADPAKHGYKFLVFLDELNRTDVKTFNSLRKLLLEKEFDNGDKLPDGCVMMAAINPDDAGGGVTELTSHMVDVLDIIPSAPNWNTSLTWLEKQSFGDDLVSGYLPEILLDLIKGFASRFGSPNDLGVEQQFTPDIGAGPMYISPREFSQIFAESVLSVDLELDEVLGDDEELGENDDPDSEETKEKAYQIQEAAFGVFEGVFRSIMTKNEVDPTKSLEMFRAWFFEPDQLIYTAIVSPAVEVSDLARQLTEFVKSIPNDDIFSEDEIIHYLNNTALDRFKADFDEFAKQAVTAGYAGKDANLTYKVYNGDDAEPTPLYDSEGNQINPFVLTYVIQEMQNLIKALDLGDNYSRVLVEVISDFVREHIEDHFPLVENLVAILEE